MSCVFWGNRQRQLKGIPSHHCSVTFPSNYAHKKQNLH